MSALATSCHWGNFYADPGPPGPSTWLARQVQLGGDRGRRFDYASAFISFDTPVKARPDLSTWVRYGSSILLAWQPKMAGGMRLADIPAGVHDAHIDSWMTYLRSLDSQVVVRFGHEFNGWWQPWHPAYRGPASSNCWSTAEFVDAWLHMIDRARARGATNVRWLWCANRSDWGGIPMEDFWPGSLSVDYVGYDSYCGMSRWSNPLDTLRGVNPGTNSAYDRVCALHLEARVFIAELGCVDTGDPANPVDVAAGHSKADWYAGLFGTDHGQVPRLAAVSFFDATGSRAWRHDTTPAAYTAFRTAFTGGKP